MQTVVLERDRIQYVQASDPSCASGFSLIAAGRQRHTGQLMYERLDIQLGPGEYPFHRPQCAGAGSRRLQLPQEPAAMQLRHLYNLGSWVRM
ncbi:hypothetical protein XENOCAPTIV_003825 [Xenoophorus captivus]|uniref:Uncharacterized protein n=1 Tax=Xenoophorus captivus TaxID=1517983 RepID=A0ABV0SD61_9TELE